MEHRFYKRKTIEMLVNISVGDEVVGNGCVSEISSGGLRIGINKSNLSIGQIIKLDLISPNTNQTIWPSVRAMVIHATNKTIGLMFAHELKVDDIISRLKSEGSFSSIRRKNHG
jgi:PilZ domain